MITQLQNDLRDDCFTLQRVFEQASETIRDESISNYPIFVLHRDEQFPIGLFLTAFGQYHTHYSYNVSTLEELVAKSIVAMDAIDEFRKIYKSPDEFFCFLIIDTDENASPHPRFWFVPIGGVAAVEELPNEMV